MTSKAPPVPTENRSPKGAGDPGTSKDAPDQMAQGQGNTDKQGQQGNAKINTTHQGYQQDR
ncbi:hypothetical protein ASG43_18475 [Aureimonas sp. Leaf454]|uniref:hypothetical protein n=1 Tax=Aureimonas sp. Leaf454 TaxID=1736381 RepID=UPI000700ECE2|nr:hypothetical protein [Aureimonas sp. Leaf454]KQT53212.1 hypothetical protein ASG43_18475 [Aureimonas sp. Leaf454]